jgi:hypothetical protein
MGLSISMSNTVVSVSKGTITGAGNSFALDSDNQFSWVPPIWPAWDADRSLFATSLLSAGILTPPEPGNPPYTDYATGLWNTVRTGIGGEDFPEPPPPKYVDFSVLTTGHAGTIGDPYSYYDMKVSVDGSNTGTYYIKGSQNGTSGLFLTFDGGSVDFKFLPWDFSINGPFRINCDDVGSPRLSGLWQQCILNFMGSGETIPGILNMGAFAPLTLNSCFVKTNAGLGITSYTSINANGSTIIAPQCAGFATINLVDSKLDIATWGGPPA